MPAYPHPTEQWLAQQLAGFKQQLAALLAGRTQYVVDADSVCQAIIGNLAAGPNGEVTGLEGWGIAVFSGSTWIRLPGVAETGDWIAPALENSWANFGGGDPVAGYFRDAMGFVHLKGHIKSGASGTTCFTLPEGFRPSVGPAFAVIGNASGTPVVGYCYVHENGTVQPTTASAVSFVSLNTISFLAEH